MSVTSVKERYDGRRSQTSGGSRSHTREFLVSTDDPTDDGQTAQTAASVPDIGDSHPTDSDADVVSKTASPNGSDWQSWVVTVEYATSSVRKNGSWEDPLDRPDEYSWGANTWSEPYFLDETTPTAKPVVNTAGEQFEQQPERHRGFPVLTIVRNESSFSQATISEYAFVVNSASFTADGETIAAGEALMMPIRAVKQVENGTTYYRVTYEMQIKDGGWDDEFLSVGFYEKNGDELKPILDENKVPVRIPWPLDASGAAKNSPTDTPATVTFKPYAAKSFAGFGFS